VCVCVICVKVVMPVHSHAKSLYTLVFIVTPMAKTAALEDFRFVVVMGCLPSSY
jgi:hypothetical protein